MLLNHIKQKYLSSAFIRIVPSRICYSKECQYWVSTLNDVLTTKASELVIRHWCWCWLVIPRTGTSSLITGAPLSWLGHTGPAAVDPPPLGAVRTFQPGERLQGDVGQVSQELLVLDTALENRDMTVSFPPPSRSLRTGRTVSPCGVSPGKVNTITSLSDCSSVQN